MHQGDDSWEPEKSVAMDSHECKSLLGHMGLVPHPAQGLMRDSHVLTSWIPPSPPSACGGEAYPIEDKAAASSRSMAHGGEAYPNAYKAAAIPRSTESSVTSVEVV